MSAEGSTNLLVATIVLGLPRWLSGKNLPEMQETWIQPLGLEDFLEKEMASHSNILTWRIPWTEDPASLNSKPYQRVGHD